MSYSIGGTLASVFSSCCSKTKNEKKDEHQKLLEDRELKLLTGAEKIEIGADAFTAVALCVGATLIVFKVFSLNPMIALGAYTGAGVILVTDVSKFMIQQARHSSRLQDKINERQELITQLNNDNISLTGQLDTNQTATTQILEKKDAEISKLKSSLNARGEEIIRRGKVIDKKNRTIEDLTAKLSLAQQPEAVKQEATVEEAVENENQEQEVVELPAGEQQPNEATPQATESESSHSVQHQEAIPTEVIENENQEQEVVELPAGEQQPNEATPQATESESSHSVQHQEAIPTEVIENENQEQEVVELPAGEQQSNEATPQATESESSHSVQYQEAIPTEVVENENQEQEVAELLAGEQQSNEATPQAAESELE